MDIQKIQVPGYEEVWQAEDERFRFSAYIAIHHSRRGPALGGVRLWHYEKQIQALDDALRLARGMTYKAAVADLPHGGGKGVILEPQPPYDRKELYSCFAEFVNFLKGRYISAKDVGTHSSDLVVMHQSTPWVVGLPLEHGGVGDPSPLTALGVKVGIEACVQERLGQKNLKGIRVAIQGLGSVGAVLARLLHQAGCKIIGADILESSVQNLANEIKFEAESIGLILRHESEVFAPCALGQVLNAHSIPELRTKIVAGSANNQLAEEEDAQRLQERNILYAPDFVINAGGLIHVACEWGKHDVHLAQRKTEQIGKTLEEIFQIAKQEKTTTYQAALRLAESRL